MSYYTTPTVKIDDGNGDYIVINESDFDPSKMKKYGEKKKPGRKPKAQRED